MLARLFHVYNVTRDARWALASQILASGANFATSVMAVRLLGLVEFGRFSLIWIALMIVRNLLIGTILTPMSAIATKLRSSTLGGYRGFLLANLLAFALLSSVLLAGMSWLIGVLGGFAWLSDAAVPFGVANFLISGSEFFRRYAFVRRAPVVAFSIDGLRYGAQLGLLVYFAQHASLGFTSSTVLWTIAGGGVLSAIFGFWQFGAIRWRPRLSVSMWPRHWNFIRWSSASVLLDAINDSIPQLAAVIFLGEAALGLTRAIQQVTNVLNLPFYSLQQVVPSLVASKLKAQGRGEMDRILKLITMANVAVCLLIGMAVYLARGHLYAMLKIQDGQEVNIIIIFCLLLNLLIAARAQSIIALNTIERPLYTFYVSLVGITASIAGCGLLLPAIGVVAVSATFCICAFLTWMMALALYQNWFNFRPL